MPDYSKSLIYKIQHLNDDNLLYIGSTTNFTKRKYKHKSACKTKKSKLYVMIRGNGGWDCFNMIVIKEFPCENKQELLIEEDNMMREMKSTLNVQRAHLTDEEIKEQKKQYRETHREELLISKKQYRKTHPEILKKEKKKYYEKHKEEILKKRKEYKAKHKEQIKQQNKEYRKRIKQEEEATKILEELWLCREHEIIRNISIARDIDYDTLMAEFGSKK
jgi:tRNA A22 N-methylase